MDRDLRGILILWLAFGSACAMPHDGHSQSPSLGTARIFHPPRTNRIGLRADVLLFSGASSWTAEVDSLAKIMLNHGATYQEVTSSELDEMPLDEILKYNLLLIPGGDAPTLTASLSAKTHARLRAAVQEGGLDYLGFCAGAWAAISPAPPLGGDVIYGLGIVDGPIQEQSYLAKNGREFAISRTQFPDGTRRDLLWYGGPVTPNIPGGVVAKYADGTPAITQIWSSKGLVIVSGLHPAVDDFIMSSLRLYNSEAIAPEFAWSLVDAGIRQELLPAF